MIKNIENAYIFPIIQSNLKNIYTFVLSHFYTVVLFLWIDLLKLPPEK